MTDTSEVANQQRDRSPAFPVVPLETALARLVEFEAHFKRTPARPDKVGDAWGIKTKAYADRITAAIRYFGLLDYQGAGKDRSVVISEEGRKYLRTQVEGTKRDLIKAAALRPKQIAKYWQDWGKDRPADAACLDALMDSGFSEAGARDFLKVYEATISFAGLTDSDKVKLDLRKELPEDEPTEDDPPPPPPPAPGKVKLMEGERIVFTEESNPQTYLKLVASGAGAFDDSLLEALEDYVKRQRKRLSRPSVTNKINSPHDDGMVEYNELNEDQKK
jgi:hypothetical protein